MTEPIQRFKHRRDFSVEEHLAYRRDGTIPETEEYSAKKKAVLVAAGLEPDDDTPDEPSVETELQRIQKRGRY